MDYNQFRASNGISRGDMIKTVKEICPKYSKATQSMVDNPDKYGVCLLPALDKLLLEKYGGRQPQKKPEPNRKKKNRFQVWLDDETAQKLIAIRARDGMTTQQLLQELIENLIALSEID